ncbi:sensor histidine kinase [Marinobacterium zhoushanense]|uniref:sensor histidine kinase n=1 Tax=Marinobacterium zhoushanense TaxID=1679163 RepID=UPI0016671F6E|nr:ATP-binding protein [Marinobacterium zhoushanense]
MLSFRPLILMALYLAVVLMLALEGAAYTRNWSLMRLHEEGTDRLLGNISLLRSALDQYRYLPFVLTQSREVRGLLRSPGAESSEPVNRYLEQINLVSGSSALMVFDLDGLLRSSSNWRDQRMLLGGSQAEMEYFRQAIAGNEGRQFVHEGVPPRQALYMSAPIYDEQRLIGVAAMRVELDKLREQLPIDYPFIINDIDGERLFSVMMPDRLPEAKSESLSDGAKIQLLTLNGIVYLAQSVVLDDLDWRVSVLSDARIVQQQQRIAAGAIGGGGFALALLFLYLRESRQKKALQLDQARERALSQERQRDMISTAQVGLINVDRSGLIQFINPMAMQQFGVSLELMRNRTVEELLSGGSSELLRETLSNLGTDRFQPLTGAEMVGRRADGTLFPMMVSVRGMTDHPELGYLVTVIDISRRKRLEQALREANESLEHKVIERTRALEEAQAELVQAGKLAALGRMSASVVHELNQPLTALRTYLAICRRQLDNPEQQRENLRQLESLIDRMALITGQLKTFAYRKPEQVGPVPVAQSIDQVLAMFRGRFSEMQLQLDYTPPASGLHLSGDQARFEQVLINLIKNACDAMQPRPGPNRLILHVASDEQNVYLSVADNGPGIAEEHRAQLFEPFFTTKEVGSGLGLGLAIVQSIVRDLGGDILATNRAEGGACFELRLKRFDSSSAGEQQPTGNGQEVI